MLEMSQIEAFYPAHLRHFRRHLLREYAQYKILAAIFEGKAGAKLAFLGGTAIHIIHGAGRFSEDLDFDNRGLSKDEFRHMAKGIAKGLALEGFTVETGVSFKGAFSADIKITGILFETGISPHREEKILIKLDAEPQNFEYRPERALLNKFDVFCGINVVPVTILLAQKFYAILNRKREMGRDFFDAIFLAGKAQPDFGYLTAKAGIADMDALKAALLKRCATFDFKRLANDAAPLVFTPSEAKKIELFPEFIKSLAP